MESRVHAWETSPREHLRIHKILALCPTDGREIKQVSGIYTYFSFGVFLGGKWISILDAVKISKAMVIRKDLEDLKTCTSPGLVVRGVGVEECRKTGPMFQVSCCAAVADR